jgi:hypothetical protein
MRSEGGDQDESEGYAGGVTPDVHIEDLPDADE